MRRTITIFAGILVGLFLAFELLDQKSDFVAEKIMWKINKRFREVTKDTKIVPDAMFDRLYDEYSNFIERFEGSRYVPAAFMFQGQTLIHKKDYDKARNVFEGVISKYSDRPQIAVRAASEIARTYSLQKDDVNILATYQRILDRYPSTVLGLKVPLLIANYYADRNDLGATQKAFEDAAHHYKNLMDQYPNSQVEFNTMSSLAQCYLAQKKWKEAVDVYVVLLLKFSEPPYLDVSQAKQITKSINTISITQMKDYDLPVEIYQNFIDAHPHHPLNETLKEMMKSFKELKKKNTEVLSTQET